MKTLFNSAAKFLLVGACLFSSSLTMAQRADQPAPYFEEKTFEIAVFPAAAPSKMWVHIDKKACKRPVSIALVNNKGQILASESYSVRQPSVRTRFDLSEIGDGVYTFRISDGRHTQERTFKLATPGFEEQLPKRLITLNEITPSVTNN